MAQGQENGEKLPKYFRLPTNPTQEEAICLNSGTSPQQDHMIKSAMNLPLSALQTATRLSNDIAVFWGQDQYSFAEIESKSRAFAGHLSNKFGINPGDRVGIWMKNCPEFITSLLGILQCDAVVVPINNFLKPAEVTFIVTDAEVRLIITDAEMDAHAEELKAAVKGLQTCVPNDETRSNMEPFSYAPAANEDDLAVIVYTSGTTGKPKGAMLTHGNLLHNIASCRKILETVDHDRFAVLLPMFHSFMLTVGLLLPLCIGGSIVLIRSLHPPRNILLEILKHGATILPAIPPFFRTMLKAELPPDTSLRLCISGAAPLPVEILHAFEKRFQVPLIEGYGLSETSPVAALNPINGGRKPGSVGLPVSNVEISICADDWSELPVGEHGELCIRGGNVMKGYLNQPEETARVLKDGWFRTGDLGFKDSDGYIFITDRKKDMLLVNGMNVYPREIEEILYQLPELREVAVVGKEDRRKGSHPIAFVVANEGTSIDREAVIAHVRSKLADYKVPREIHILDALPRNATGKILKTNLRERINRLD